MPPLIIQTLDNLDLYISHFSTVQLFENKLKNKTGLKQYNTKNTKKGKRPKQYKWKSTTPCQKTHSHVRLSEEISRKTIRGSSGIIKRIIFVIIIYYGKRIYLKLLTLLSLNVRVVSRSLSTGNGRTNFQLQPYLVYVR